MTSPINLNHKSPSWLVILAMTVPAFVMGSVNFGLSLFFKSIQTAFDWNRVTTSSGYTAYSLCMGAAIITVGYLLDRYGYRSVALLMAFCTGGGIILLSRVGNIHQFRLLMATAGFGTGACLIVPSTIAQQWFSERRGQVLGIITAAMGVGLAVMPPVINYLISSYSWRTAYLTLGSFILVIILSSMFAMGNVKSIELRSREKRIQNTAVTGPVWKPQQAVRTIQFLSIAAGGCLAFTSLNLIMVHLAAYATDGGISSSHAAWAMTVMGILGIPVRLSLGQVVKKIGWFKLMISSNFLFITGILLIINLGDSLWRFYLAACFLGCGMGTLTPAIPGILGTYFGMQSLGTVLGINQGSAMVISGVLGPFLGGVSYDLTHSYLIAFLIALGLLVISGIFFLRARRPPDVRESPQTSAAK